MVTDELTCADVERQGLAERYAAGTLPVDDIERFETHFLTCERCQLAVELAAAVRSASRSATPVRARAAAQQRLRRMLLSYAGVAAAAGIAAVTVLHWREVRRVRSLGALAAPPAYAGVQVRGEASAGDSLFGRAMQAYAGRDYRAAAAALRASLAAGAAPEPTSFFLGASLLMERQPLDAADAFARVETTGPSPYLFEAHYYRALALLQANRPADAAVELRTVAGDTGQTSARARALLAQLGETARRRSR